MQRILKRRKATSLLLLIILMASFLYTNPVYAVAPTKLTITGATASTSETDHGPEKSYDVPSGTYWCGVGSTQTAPYANGPYIKYDLGSTKAVNYVKLHWYLGNTQREYFSIQVSTDNTNWTTVLNQRLSKAENNLAQYDFAQTSARYVRIVCAGNTTAQPQWNSLVDIEIWGVDVPQPVIFTISSATASTSETDHGPEKSYDIPSGTYWCGVGSTQTAPYANGPYIKYDLGSTKAVNYVKLHWYLGNTQREYFSIQVSTDNTNWTTVLNQRLSNAENNLVQYDFAQTSARYVRIVCAGNNTVQPQWNSLVNIEIYGQSSPQPNKYYISTATASTSETDHGPEKSYDVPSGTYWCGVGSTQTAPYTNGPSITYDLGYVKSVSYVKLHWYMGATQREYFEIHVSNDNETWTTALGQTLSEAYDTLRQYNFTQTNARYVKIVCKGNTTAQPQWNSLVNIEIYGLSDPGGAQKLFASDFGSGVTLQGQDTDQWRFLTGASSTAGFDGNWADRILTTQGQGASTQSSAVFTLVQPVNNHNTTPISEIITTTGPFGGTCNALRLAMYDPHRSSQNALMLQKFDTAPEKLYVRERIKLPSDLNNKIVKEQEAITWNGGSGTDYRDWRAVFEWKTGDMKLSECYGDLRFKLEVIRETSQSPLCWKATIDTNANGKIMSDPDPKRDVPFTTKWTATSSAVSVPVNGEWFKLEAFWTREINGGLPNGNGRIWIAVNGTTIFNQVFTDGSTLKGINQAPIGRIMFLNNYSSQYTTANNPADSYITYFEVWDDFPSDASSH